MALGASCRWMYSMGALWTFIFDSVSIRKEGRGLPNLEGEGRGGEGRTPTVADGSCQRHLQLEPSTSASSSSSFFCFLFFLLGRFNRSVGLMPNCPNVNLLMEVRGPNPTGRWWGGNVGVVTGVLSDDPAAAGLFQHSSVRFPFWRMWDIPP